MTLFNSLILAVVQSVTEFLPVSSSAHLVILSRIMGMGDVPVLFDLVLHLGTVTATVLVYYKIIGEIFGDLFRTLAGSGRPECRERERGNVKLFIYIILSTVVTGIIGFALRNPIESFFRARANIVPLFLLATGIILLATKFIQKGRKEIGGIGIGFPLLIGIVQAVAMLPGVSRSGTTISAGLFAGVDRGFAGLYSFLLSIPSVLGATVIEYVVTRGANGEPVAAGIYVLAYLVTALVGYGALRLLLGFLKRGKLFTFSLYCFAAGIAGFLFMNHLPI